MSTPLSYQIDLDAERREAQHAAMMRQISLGDVLAVVDELIAVEADPAVHPAASIVQFYLARGGTDTGTKPHTLILSADALDRLVCRAIDQLVDEIACDDSAWEGE